MENKICPLKSGMEKQTVYCSPDCGYYCEAGKDTKCGIAIAGEVQRARMLEIVQKLELVHKNLNAIEEAIGK